MASEICLDHIPEGCLQRAGESGRKKVETYPCVRALRVCVPCVGDELLMGGKQTLEQRFAFQVSEDPHAEKVSLQNQKEKVSALNSFLLISRQY